jgi:hypothetical protein
MPADRLDLLGLGLGLGLDQRRPFRQTGKLVREGGQVSPGTMPDGSLTM